MCLCLIFFAYGCSLLIANEINGTNVEPRSIPKLFTNSRYQSCK